MANPPDTPTPAPGAASYPMLFRRYQLVRELGRGGMGVVYLAQDTALDVLVAIKIVPDMVAKDTDAVTDLRKEVLRGMALAHPGVVRTHHFERDESGAAIVMEYVDGETLNGLRSQQPGGCCDPWAILPWLDQLASVLDYAHREAHLVHRDLKPRNIMLTSDGRLKVADFGIAAVLSDSMSRHSMEGKVSGTLGYMSPQQAQGMRPTAMDDIYSVGATLYDLLTGRPPFFRGNPAAILAQITSVVPPSIASRREELEIQGKLPLHPVWEEVLAACLAKDPASRPPSVGEIVARLRRADSSTATSYPSVAPPLPPPPPQPAPQARYPDRLGSLPPVPPLHPPPPVGHYSAPPFQPPPKRGNVATILGILLLLALAIGGGLYLGLVYDGPNGKAPPKGGGGSARPVQISATRERPFSNSIGMRFVPAGTSDVLMSVWETRRGDFAAFAAALPKLVPKGIWISKAVTKPEGGYTFQNTYVPDATWQSPGFSQGDDHPVVGIDLATARQFCRWLTAKEQSAGLLPAGAFYAIPTDEEWSAAVGQGKYLWGNSGTVPPRGGNYWDAVACSAHPGEWVNALNLNDGSAFTAPVGAYDSNSYGIYDLAGNVWEWNDSLYPVEKQSSGYLAIYDSSVQPFDADGAPLFVARGGSWYSSLLVQMEVATYNFMTQFNTDAEVGFRTVLVLAPRKTADFRRRGQMEANWDPQSAVAAADYEKLLELDPNDYTGLSWRYLTHSRAGQYREAAATQEAAYRSFSRYPESANNLAWALATSPEESVRNGRRAVALALEACQSTKYKSAQTLDTLAAAYAEVANWKGAVEKQKAAIALLDKSNQAVIADFQARLELYESQHPYRHFPKP